MKNNITKLPKNLLIDEADAVLQPSVAAFYSAESLQFRTVLAQSHKIFRPYNQYNSVSGQGKVGKYQFNSQTLEDLGYIKTGITTQFKLLPKSSAQVVNNDAHWTGLNQCSSLSLFLSNQGEQESAIVKLYNNNYQWLSKNTLFFNSLPQSEKFGLLMVAFVKSKESAVTLYDYFMGRNLNGDSVDEQGFLSSSYFQAGVDACEFGKILTIA